MGDLPVSRNIVAGHDRERRNTLGAAFGEPCQDEAEDGFWSRRIARILDDRRMRRVEDAGCRIDEIAAFGDRQGDDADERARELRHDRGRVAGLEVGDHGAGDMRARAVVVLLDHRRQEILRFELVAHDLVRWQDTRADDRPIAIASQVEKVIEIDRLMRAVEIADAEVHDAGPKVMPAVVRDAGRGFDRVERGKGEFGRHPFNPFANEPQLIQLPPSTL